MRSRLRIKLAAMIERQFSADGMVVTVKPGRLYPATGWWRTSPQADCYRWEGTATWHHDGDKTSKGVPISVDSWEPMTTIVRSGGVVLTRHRSTQFEAWPKPSK